MNRHQIAGLVAGLGAFATPLAAQLRVVTTTTDLHAIAHEVGGDKITAIHISEGYQDPHYVEAKPSFVLKLRNADVFAFVGLDLEVGWLPLLIDGSRNARIRPGAAGSIDMSKAVEVIDVPSGNVDRSQGDVHTMGNPHYWLDPDNARKIAHRFKEKFSELDPKNAAVYDRNAQAFDAKLDAAAKTWAPLLAQIKGKPVVAWHTSWRYFAEYTKMNIVAFMEPKPGVPPSPGHLASVIATVKRTGAKVIIMEPFYDRKTADVVAKQTGITVLQIPPSVEGVKGVDTYIKLITHDLTKLAAALK
ncbi:MAG: metal ABC transporter substrate-binding protein [Gemmatimonadaceae bacterium]